MERIAIVGGGMGGLSAAYGLVACAGVSGSDITVFQMGWRLGGKCATGRGPCERIEEHGIHGFLGCYYNTLLMMKHVYESLPEDPRNPIGTFDKAFVRINTGLHWERDGGVLKRWPKWTPPSELRIETIKDIAPNLLLAWLTIYARVLAKKLEGVPDDSEAFAVAKSARWADTLVSLRDIGDKAANLFQNDLETLPTRNEKRGADFWHAMNKFIDRPVRHSTKNGDAVRRNLLEIEMFQVILRGIRDDEIFIKGFGSIDDVNFADWFRKHKASGNLLESPLVAYIANLTFQYPQGDISLDPQVSAASYVQWALRSAAYVEESLWLFAAGTGETVITPLYLYLREKGVNFCFFHELTDIETSEDGATAVKLTFQQQAKMKASDPYAPLHVVKGLHCWSNKPDFDQLEATADMSSADFERPGSAAFGDKVTFNVGSDANSNFSKIILAIPPAAICESAPSLLRSNAHWRERVAKMPTTATQAMQLWFKQPIEALAGMPSLLGDGGVRPFYYGSANFPGEMHGVLDFTKYLEFENWGADGPKGLLYGCGVMVDPPIRLGMSLRSAADLRAYETSRTMLTVMGTDLLPMSSEQAAETTNPHSLDFGDLFVHPDSPHARAVGQKRLADHYFRGNVYPSERYTQSPPSTRSMRINPLNPHISNLTGAGDWVDTVLNMGSVECSVMGGLLAAAYVTDRSKAAKVIGAWVTPADSLLAT